MPHSVGFLDETADAATRKRSDFGVDLARLDVLGFLDELRTRLLVCLLSLLGTVVLCFSFSERLFDVFMAPLLAALPPGGTLIATRVTEVFLLHVQMSLLAGVALVAPVWLYQLHRLVRTIRPSSVRVDKAWPVVTLGCLLFALGAAFAHFVLFPYAAGFLTRFGSSTVHPRLSVGAAFSFYETFILGLGAAFQIPTVVYVLSLLDLVTPRSLLRSWKHVVLAVFVLAAVLTPTPDVVTQSLLALPMLGLYVVSIALCWLVRRRARARA